MCSNMRFENQKTCQVHFKETYKYYSEALGWFSHWLNTIQVFWVGGFGAQKDPRHTSTVSALCP